MVEEIGGASQKIVGIEGPAAKGNSYAELVLFVAFAVERNKTEILIVGGGEKWTGNSEQRRSLIEMSVEGAENPVKLGDLQEAPTRGLEAFSTTSPEKWVWRRPAFRLSQRVSLNCSSA